MTIHHQESTVAVPERMIKHVYCHRRFVVNQTNVALGCHFLNQLGAENKEKVVQHYCGFLVLRGTGLYRDWEGREHRLCPGAFAQHLPGKKHDVIRVMDGQWVEASLSCGAYLYRHFAGLGLVHTEMPVLYPGFSLAILEQFESLHHNLGQFPEKQLPRLLIRAQELLLSISEQAFYDPGDSSTDRRISQACDLLGVALQRSLSMPDIAQRLNMSYSHFRRLFRQQVGCSPGEYRKQKRLEQAKLMLADADISIKDIADQLGYSDQFAFSRQFKQATALSPSNYRKA